MRARTCYWLATLAGLALPAAGGIWGTPDVVPAATLVVPFFEVGIDPQVDPHDTLTVVYNRSVDGVTLHYEVWSVDGARAASAHGNVELPSAGSWSGSLRTILSGTSPVDLAMLVDEGFYRGFMTIDLVTASTELSPFEASYPFAPQNALLGYAYFVRLAQGSANGLAMIHLEHTELAGVPARLEGFYGQNDDREEIDVNARRCTASLSKGETAVLDDYLNGCNFTIDDNADVRARIFQSEPLSGRSRVVVFAWDTSRPDAGGPSAICAANPGLGCSTSYAYSRVLQSAVVAEAGSISLDHVVNVLEPTGTTGPGEYLIFGIQDPGESLQLFAFSFNSASPPGNPAINWDAIFEASIDP